MPGTPHVPHAVTPPYFQLGEATWVVKELLVYCVILPVMLLYGPQSGRGDMMTWSLAVSCVTVPPTCTFVEGLGEGGVFEFAYVVLLILTDPPDRTFPETCVPLLRLMSLGSAATLVVLMSVPWMLTEPLASMLPFDPALAALPTFPPPYGQGAGLHAREL